jgi:hypothetical protein
VQTPQVILPRLRCDGVRLRFSLTPSFPRPHARAILHEQGVSTPLSKHHTLTHRCSIYLERASSSFCDFLMTVYPSSHLQYNIECSRQQLSLPLTPLKKDQQRHFTIQIERGHWLLSRCRCLRIPGVRSAAVARQARRKLNPLGIQTGRSFHCAGHRKLCR